MWDSWDIPEAEVDTSSPPDEPKEETQPRMGLILLVHASEDDNGVYAIDTHGIWRWSSAGNLLSKCEFISEHGQTLGPALVAAVSLAGRKAAIALADGFICIADISTGRTLYSPFAAHAIEVEALAMSIDGKYLISAAGDGSVRIWSTDNATLIDPRRSSTQPSMGALDLGTPCVAITSTHYAHALDEVHLYAHGSGDSINLVNNEADNVCALQFADDGSTIGACYLSGRVTVWEVQGGAAIYSRDWTISPDEILSRRAVFDNSLRALAYIQSSVLDNLNHEYSVLDLYTGDVVDVNSGATSPPTCGALLGIGKGLLIGSQDGIVRIVNCDEATRYVPGPRHADSVSGPLLTFELLLILRH